MITTALPISPSLVREVLLDRSLNGLTPYTNGPNRDRRSATGWVSVDKRIRD